MNVKPSIARAAIFGLPAAFVALTVSVRAQPMGEPPTMATFVCRLALSGEAATAKMVQSSSLLVCKPFSVTVTLADGTLKTIGNVTAKPQRAPDFSTALTAQQVTAAYNAWIGQALRIDPATEHAP